MFAHFNKQTGGTVAKEAQGREENPDMEKALKEQDGKHYVLRLYVAGMSPRSTRAVTNIKKFCEEYLKGRYSLEVIDIYNRPTLADGEQIIAAPTLLKKLPLPLRRFIGDMSDIEKIVVGLDLRPKKDRRATV
jgi:circadian clock protein KaiB